MPPSRSFGEDPGNISGFRGSGLAQIDWYCLFKDGAIGCLSSILGFHRSNTVSDCWSLFETSYEHWVPEVPTIDIWWLDPSKG